MNDKIIKRKRSRQEQWDNWQQEWKKHREDREKEQKLVNELKETK